jgi:predicted anti-sigma-YlaC factor YlaD
MTPSLTCQELVEIITDYLEEKLAGEEKLRFEDHLESCSDCRLYLDQMRKTIALTGQLTEESIPEDNKAELLRLFRDWKANQNA